MSRRTLVSCYQCAALHHCHDGNGALDREHARAQAGACSSWHKGLNTEVVRVIGQARGMSRKRAQRLCAAGRAHFVGPALLSLSSATPVGAPAHQQVKTR
jgi:hypothetical protein